MTLAVMSAKTTTPQFSGNLIQLPDRWYLDFLCRRTLPPTQPYLFGTQALNGADVTIYVLASGICSSKFFGNRVRYLLGDAGVDSLGYGSAMAFVLGGYGHGMATKCKFVSLNVYTNEKVDATLYNQAVELILADVATLQGRSAIVLTCAIREPTFGDLVVYKDLNVATNKLIEAGLIIVSCAGDGLWDTNTAELKGPILAEACAPNQLDSVFTIGAIDIHGVIPSFSNYGRAVTAFAPGVDITTLNKDGKFILLSSTKLSAALVASIFALYLEKFPFATIQDINKFVYEHFLPTGNAEPYPLTQLQKDIFESNDFGTFQLMYDSGTIFPYLINTKVPFRLAHAFFTTAIVSVPTTSLGTILANTQFEIPIGVKLKNLYEDEKPCMYTLISVTPNIGEFKIGEQSGILFGFIEDIDTTTVCVLEIGVSDGLNQYRGQFTLHIQPNYVDKQLVGGSLRGILPNVSGLDLIDTVHPPGLFLDELVPPLQSRQIPIKRDLMLLSTYGNKFMGNVVTDFATGQFFKEVPVGSYTAIVFDKDNLYDVFVLDNIQVVNN